MALTALVFDSTVENGGHGVEIEICLVQAACVVQRDIRESRLDRNGNRWHNDDIVV